MAKIKRSASCSSLPANDGHGAVSQSAHNTNQKDRLSEALARLTLNADARDVPVSRKPATFKKPVKVPHEPPFDAFVPGCGFVAGPYYGGPFTVDNPLEIARINTRICGFPLEDGSLCGQYGKTTGEFRNHVREAHLIPPAPATCTSPSARYEWAEAHKHALVPYANGRGVREQACRQRLRDYVSGGHFHAAKLKNGRRVHNSHVHAAFEQARNALDE